VPTHRSWSKLKKTEPAALAEREIHGIGWLPQPLRNELSSDRRFATLLSP